MIHLWTQCVGLIPITGQFTSSFESQNLRAVSVAVIAVICILARSRLSSAGEVLPRSGPCQISRLLRDWNSRLHSCCTKSTPIFPNVIESLQPTSYRSWRSTLRTLARSGSTPSSGSSSSRPAPTCPFQDTRSKPTKIMRILHTRDAMTRASSMPPKRVGPRASSTMRCRKVLERVPSI